MTYLICIIMSAISMYFMTKIAIKLSNKVSFYDVPKGRNMHKSPTPILGGFALLISIAINVIIYSQWEWGPFSVAAIGAILIFLIGLYDDSMFLNHG